MEKEVGVRVVDGLRTKTGLRLNFIGKTPSQFKVPNKIFIQNNKEFFIGKVRKLTVNEVIEELGEDKLQEQQEGEEDIMHQFVPPCEEFLHDQEPQE